MYLTALDTRFTGYFYPRYFAWDFSACKKSCSNSLQAHL